MMKKNILILLIFIFSSTFAQENIEQLLKSVAKENKAIQSYRKHIDHEMIKTKTELTPSDPEIGYKMMPDGNYELEFSQGFHFPTYYMNKYKTANLIQLQQGLELQIFITNILHNTKLKSLELIYYNQRIPVLEKRQKNASELYELMKKLLKSGEGTQLEVNKAKLHLVNLQSELSSLKIIQKNLIISLCELNGGIEVNLNLVQYPEYSEILYNELERTYLERTPEIALLKVNIAISQKKLQLAKSLRLPSFSLGCFTNSEKETGPIFGISLPLWENRNKVKSAKAGANYEEMKEKSQLSIQLSELKQLYDLKLDYENRIKSLVDVLITDNTKLLLEKSLKEGEISGITYYIELESLYEMIDNLMELKRDLSATNAEIFKYELVEN